MNSRLITWSFIIAAVVLAAGSTLLPITFQAATKEVGHAFLASSLLQAILQLGAAILFIIGLKHFKEALKRSYFLIAASIFLLGLARMQLPLFQSLNLWDTPWINYGLLESIPALAHFIMFIGVVSFTNLLKLNSKITSFLRTAGGLLLCMAAITLIPHPSNDFTELAFDLSNNFLVIVIYFGILSAILVFKIKQNTIASYTNAMAWLFAAILFSVLSAGQLLLFYFIGFDNFYVQSGLILLPYLISSVLYIKAGYAFNLIELYTVTAQNENHASYIDVIIYATNLASNPHLVEPYRETLREITSQISPGQTQFSSDIQGALSNLYLTVEGYLIENEPLKKITKDELRSNISKKFNFSLPQ